MRVTGGWPIRTVYVRMEGMKGGYNSDDASCRAYVFDDKRRLISVDMIKVTNGFRTLAPSGRLDPVGGPLSDEAKVRQDSP
jgi:hypothetical protein